MNYDENEEEPLTTFDTDNATRLNSAEADSDSGKWERLSSVNTGVVDSYGNRDESRVRRQERAVAFDIMSDKLGLIDLHRREGREIMKNGLDTQRLSSPNSSVHLIAFCLAVNLVNRDNIPRSYHPERSDANNDKIFLEIAEEFGFDRNLINSYIQKVGMELDF